MPLVIFIGISSVGAVFMVVFFAALWGEQRPANSDVFAAIPPWLRSDRVVLPSSVVKVAGPNVLALGGRNAVIVLRPRAKDLAMSGFSRAQRAATARKALVNLSVKN